MNQFRQDIEDFSKIWDKALADGVFDDAPKTAPRVLDLSNDNNTDFFGQNLSAAYNIDAPLNEADVKAWRDLAKTAADHSPYFNPVNEEREYSKGETKKASKKLGSTFNPVYPNTINKDQDLGTPVKVTQNWGVGGKELNDLEDLKKRLHALEIKLSQAGILKIQTNKKKKDSDDSTIQKGINDLKKQIDDLSDKLNGNRNDAD